MNKIVQFTGKLKEMESKEKVFLIKEAAKYIEDTRIVSKPKSKDSIEKIQNLNIQFTNFELKHKKPCLIKINLIKKNNHQNISNGTCVTTSVIILLL